MMERWQQSLRNGVARLWQRIDRLWKATSTLWPFRRERGQIWTAEFVESDLLPAKLPSWRVVIARDDYELWSAGMMCPCGCGEVIELALFPEAEQHWRVEVDGMGRATLSPSIWRRTGCRSHFWMRGGQVHWC